ncbi:MAG: amidase [Pseudomonadales bacterium]|jgi:aspartyl-tRNA(Asn)/glutamyl-tRNA(Gln) amidotransferase subunit A
MNIWQMSGLDIAQMIKQKKISSVEVMEATLGHINENDERYNGFSNLNDAALALARQVDKQISRGVDVGPLHGVPFTVKDLLNTKDMPTTFCSKAFANHTPASDAIVVSRMIEAGGILLGKTTSSEFAMKITTSSALCGVTRNPWSVERSCGGSSGGAGVTVATGMGPLAISTDGGGSSRVPAAACGVLGLKPTLGAIPCETWPFHYGNNSTTSINTRCVDDLVLMWNIIAGECKRDPWSRRKIDQLQVHREVMDLLKNKRALFIPAMSGHTADAEILAKVEKVLADLEGIGLRVDAMETDPTDYDISIFSDLITVNLAARFRLMDEKQQVLLDPGLQPLLDPALYQIDGVKLQTQAIKRSRLYERTEALFDQYEYIFTPTVTARPPLVESGSDDYILINGEQLSLIKWWGHLSLPNLTGHPAISIPCGFTDDQLPIGLHSIGRWDREQSLVDLASTIHSLLPWTESWPESIR